MTTDEPRWAARFRAPRMTLPGWALDAPHRCMYASTQTGVVELYTWDRETGTHRQATDRPAGTCIGALDPSGEYLWWFADTDGDEWGVWMRQRFAGGDPEPALPGLPPAYPAGLAIGSGVVVAGRTTEAGTTLHLVREGYEFTLYDNQNHAYVGAMSRDESLLCIAHSEHGDPRHHGLRVVQIEDGTRVAELWDGPDKDLTPAGFSPVKGDSRLLVSHERHGIPGLLIWDAVAGRCDEVPVELPGEIDADWFPDGSALLISHDYAARTELYRLDLATRQLSWLETPPGVISGATARPDGSVEYSWSSSAMPHTIRNNVGAVVLETPGDAPPSAPAEDLWVEGPAGAIHALMIRPAHLLPPYSTVFLLHGGPDTADDDTFRPRRAAWVDTGYCVVHVNFRGSTGYGAEWREALAGRPGLTELEDVAAVRDWLVQRHLAHPQRCILAGESWGGYLTLLGLGTQPERWAAGVASGPIADYITAYEEEIEPLRAVDEAIFGGTPKDLRQSYVRSSPISYADRVAAPLLIMAGADDPRCPTRQLENYLMRLTQLGKQAELYRVADNSDIEERIRQTAVELDFALRHVRP